jgi:hypothetical protein
MGGKSDPAVRVPSTGAPRFVMVGIDADRGMCRLYASRDVKSTAWGLRDRPDYTTAWHVDADMQHVLIIDKPSWGEAFAHAFTIWDNEDREAGRRQALSEKQARKAVHSGKQLMRGGIED